MGREKSSIGVFGFIGRSRDLRQLDDALRALDLHPRLMPEAVKLTVCNILKDAAAGQVPSAEATAAAAELLAYLMTGADHFSAVNGRALMERCERRIEQAAAGVEDGGIDADLILLAIHAKILQPSVRDRFDLTSESA